MGRAKGAVNYQNKVLIPIISQMLPNSSLGWQAVAIAYHEKSKESAVHDGEAVKTHWVKKLCNGMKKPTGKTGENGDRIHECIEIERRIMEKTHSGMLGLGPVEVDDDEDDYSSAPELPPLTETPVQRSPRHGLNSGDGHQHNTSPSPPTQPAAAAASTTAAAAASTTAAAASTTVARTTVTKSTKSKNSTNKIKERVSIAGAIVKLLGNMGGDEEMTEEMAEEMAEVLREEAEVEAAYQKEFWGEKS
jgi:hypothetical protein